MFHPRGPTFLELARQGLSSTQRGYDLLAPKFDYTPFRTPDAVMRVAGEQLARYGPFADGLDLCCGTGAGLHMLQPLCTRRVIGLDFSAGMLGEARRQLDDQLADHLGIQPVDHSGEAVALVQADALALPYDGAFDVVTCFGALGHVPRRDQRRFVAGIFQALRPGGLFAFVTAPMPRAFSRSWLLGHSYNAVARVRNALVRPPFEMEYLTFTLAEAERLLASTGFEVTVERHCFEQPYRHAVLVLARRPQWQSHISTSRRHTAYS